MAKGKNKEEVMDEAKKASDIADRLLQLLEACDVCPLVANSALGDAWFRMCKGMNYSKERFSDILNAMKEVYEKD